MVPSNVSTATAAMLGKHVQVLLLSTLASCYVSPPELCTLISRQQDEGSLNIHNRPQETIKKLNIYKDKMSNPGSPKTPPAKTEKEDEPMFGHISSPFGPPTPRTTPDKEGTPISEKMASNPVSPLTPRITPETERFADIKPDDDPQPEAITGIKVQLYFGLCSDYRADITEEEFQEFVDIIISPLFPNLSVSKLHGQWVSETNKTIMREPSRCAEILDEDTPKVHKNCGIICDNFKRLFLQDSVLRVVTPCTYYFH